MVVRTIILGVASQRLRDCTRPRLSILMGERTPGVAPVMCCSGPSKAGSMRGPGHGIVQVKH